MKPVLQILYGALLEYGSAWGLGMLLLHVLRIRLRRVEHHLFSFLAGSAVLSLLVFLLGVLRRVRQTDFQVLGLALIATGIWVWRRERTREAFERLPKLWTVLFLTGLVAYGVHYFFNALAPDISPDGSSYHLEIVSEYLRRHGLVPIPTNMYASLPQGLEMLFLFAFALGRNSAAAMVHFGFLMTLPLLVLSFGRRFGFPREGVFGAMLVFASPLVGVDGISAYNDVALATTAFGLFYALQLWDESRDARFLPLAGLLAGFCYSLKYTGALAVPFAIGYVAWRLLRAGQPWPRASLLVALTAAVSVAPWLIKNWVWMGNPLAPFCNALFPNPNFQILGERTYLEVLRHFPDGTSRLKGLLDVTLSDRVSGGLIGLVFLLTPLGLLSLRFPVGRRLWLAAAVFLPGYLGNYGGRFLLPVLPFLALALGLALRNTPGALPALLVFHLVISWNRVEPVYARPAWRLQHTPVRAALRLIPEEKYLEEWIPCYLACRMIDENTPPGAVVFTAEPIPSAYTSRRIVASYPSAAGRTLSDILRTPLRPALQPSVELRLHFPEQPLRGLRVVRIAPQAPEEWSITELRVWLAGREIERKPSWRLRASPNPWQVQSAFDNSYVTRWVSAEPAKPGMKMEVEFAEPETADLVTIETRESRDPEIRLEARDASGRWDVLDWRPEGAKVRPLHGLRRAAAEELKARGVGYLLVQARDFGAMDFQRNAAVWGITPLEEREGARLYRID